MRLRTVFGLAVSVTALAAMQDGAAVGKGKRKGPVRAEVVRSAVPLSAAAAPDVGPSRFSPQFRLGYTVGDQWEPAIAADDGGNVYVLYPQYLGVPGCDACPSPTMILQISRDGGSTWLPPRQIATPGSGQYDAQIAVDPLDGSTVYASWLQNSKSDTVVARSDDFGVTWSVVVADSTQAGTDKPILVVRGDDVYVGFNHANKVWVAASHDGGRTFTSANVNPNGKLGWSLAGGGAILPDGSVHFSWAGYERNGGATGDVNLYVSSSSDGGSGWTTRVIDVSGAPPDCSDHLCGWAFLGAQATLAADEGGTLYALWNVGETDGGPERIYFSRSSDGGRTWSPRSDVSEAPAGAHHAFPAIAATGNGDVRIAWMDARNGSAWNTYYRSSTDGGQRWSRETDLSTQVAGFSYITAEGFSFPFGDYFELDIDSAGRTHAVWGEGLNYDSPGSIWYARGR